MPLGLMMATGTPIEKTKIYLMINIGLPNNVAETVLRRQSGK
jgi:hypothetical protein